LTHNAVAFRQLAQLGQRRIVGIGLQLGDNASWVRPVIAIVVAPIPPPTTATATAPATREFRPACAPRAKLPRSVSSALD
jgi:hypothetical protein